MTSPEQSANQSSQIDAQKEQVGQTLFQVRFGLGPHPVRVSDWHDALVQDLDSYFQSSNTTQRNIFFSEDALGSQSYLDILRTAYKNYGKYTTAFAYTRLHRLRDGFPSADSIETQYNTQVLSQHPFMSDGARFIHEVFGALDGIIERRGIKIDLETETRKDPRERQQIERILTLAQKPRLQSVEEFHRQALMLWNMKRIRDRKIVEDLADLYKKAIRKNESTRIYVSLGQNHSGVSDLLAAKLYKRPSHEISVIRGELHSSKKEIFPAAIALLDSGSEISPEQWQALFESCML